MNEVGICNLALSHIGDTATVMSIKPPDQSVQAQLCSRFYYIARNSLLEAGTWSFSLRRALLALVSDPLAAGGDCTSADSTTSTTTCTPWSFAYAAPSDMLNALAVQDSDAPDDYQAWFGPMGQNGCEYYPQGYMPVPGAPYTVPRPFETETNTDGSQVILTNVCDAVLRYTGLVEDPTKFSQLFTMALSHLLASMLAGPIIKGDAGIEAAQQQLQLYNNWKSQAAMSDANQRKTHVEASPAWIRGR